MFRNLWKGTSRQKKGRRPEQFKLRSISDFGRRIEALEARAMFSGAGVDSGIASDPATHLAVFSPPVALAGSAVPVVVVALDADNVPTSDFTDSISLDSTDGTAQVSTSLAGAGAAVPFDYAFQSSNDGHQLFFITYGANTSGPQTLTASDTTDTAISDDTAYTNVVTPAVATHFAVIVKPNLQAGAAASVLVEALDANNHVVPNYEGTITLSSSDTAATVSTDNGDLSLPQSYTFTADDHGRHQFQVTFNTAGPQTTISADDSTGSARQALARPTSTRRPRPRTSPCRSPPIRWSVCRLRLMCWPSTPTIVWCRTTRVRSRSRSITTPRPHCQQAIRSQRRTTATLRLQVKFDTPGPETITVADATNTVPGTASTNVASAPVATQFLVQMPSSIPAGVPVQVFVVPLDASGRPVPNYTGTISFASSDPSAVLPANFTFGSSIRPFSFHAFSVTFETTGEQTLAVTDDNVNTSTGSASINVRAAVVATSLRVDAPQNAPVGVPVVVRVEVLDASGNPIPNFDGQFTLTSGDPAAQIVPLASLLPGGVSSNLFAVVFGTAGPQTLTATDSADSLTGNATVNVLAGILDPTPRPPGGPKAAAVKSLANGSRPSSR